MQTIEPHSILAPIETGTRDIRVYRQRVDHYTTHGLINFKIHPARPAPSKSPVRNSTQTNNLFLKINVKPRAAPGIYVGGPTEFPGQQRTMPKSRMQRTRESRAMKPESRALRANELRAKPHREQSPRVKMRLVWGVIQGGGLVSLCLICFQKIKLQTIHI